MNTTEHPAEIIKRDQANAINADLLATLKALRVWLIAPRTDAEAIDAVRAVIDAAIAKAEQDAERCAVL